jgi:hypothetical protein
VAFRLFQLVTVLVLLRPSDLVPSLSEVPLYEAAIVLALAARLAQVLEQLSVRALIAQPINLCVVGLLPAVTLSHLVHLNTAATVSSAFGFSKIMIFYLLLVTSVDTAARMNRFLSTVVGCTVVLTALSLLQYYAVIDIPALQSIEDAEIDDASGDAYYLLRLCGAGIFHDPNDFALILITAMVVCLYRIAERGTGPARIVWLGPLLLFTFALTKTHSRGGFMALLTALVILLVGRFGWRRALPLLIATLPAVFILFAGRQTNLSATSDTGQQRIQIWSDGLVLFRATPLFGIGQNRYAEVVGIVAHNSFVHAFVELGLFGGTLFLGAFYSAFASLGRLGRWESFLHDPTLRRLRPYLLAIVASYGVGLLSLSRTYIVSTYLILGMASAYLKLALERSPLQQVPVGLVLACRLMTLGVVFLVATYAFVRFFARFGG